jgi:hypothetical protein
MIDVTVASFEDMEPIFEGLARRARATLGVSSFGMQVFTLPPAWDGYPDHRHDATVEDANQEEVYIPLEGSATLVAGSERFELRPGMMARVGPEQLRRVLPGPDGVRFVALGGVPGTFTGSPWTQLGGPPPVPAS